MRRKPNDQRVSPESTPAVPLPGMRSEDPGTEDYLVVLRDDDAETEGDALPSRQEVIDAGHGRAQAFQAKLTQLLQSKKLMSDVSAIGAATAFASFAIRCTPVVAKFIEQLPEVESVLKDSDDFRLIR